jgi:hypothetical protein
MLNKTKSVILRLVSAVAIVAAVVGDAYAATPADLIARAAKRSGEAVIRTAEITFEATITKEPPSKEQIAEAVERMKQSILVAIKSYDNNPEYKKRLEDSLPDNERYTTEHVIANAKVIVSGVYMIGGPRLGGDRFVEFRVRQGYDDPKSQSQAMALLIRHLPNWRQTSLLFNAQTRTAVASGNGVMAGINDPHVLGRLQGSVLANFGGDIEAAGAAKSIEKPTLSLSFRGFKERLS